MTCSENFGLGLQGLFNVEGERNEAAEQTPGWGEPDLWRVTGHVEASPHRHWV